MNDQQVEALADEIERNEDWATGVSRDQDKIIIEALRAYARTPSAPDAAMREALKRLIHSVCNLRVPHEVAEQIKILVQPDIDSAAAALSASEAKAGEPVESEFNQTGNELLKQFVETYSSGASGCSMDCDTAKAMAKAICGLLSTPPQVDREAVARRICDGFTNGNIQFDEADQALQYSCLMAADAVLAPTAPAQEGE